MIKPTRVTPVFLFALLLLLPAADSFVVFAERSNAQNSTAPARPGQDLSALAWMEGHWIGKEGTVDVEEFWLGPKGNTMLGLHRDVAGTRTRMFEFLRIEATAEAITYWASPKGRPATPFRLKELNGQHVTFENPEHDFPQRIIYWLAKDGALHAKIEGTMNGKAASQEWRWLRKK